MERNIIITIDGSSSVEIPSLGETYHSHHGAIQESLHVFINAGLLPLIGSTLHHPFAILEIGFGTGLNALLTLMEADKTGHPVHYTTLEPFPLEANEVAALNYCDRLIRPDLQQVFNQLHDSSWEEDVLPHPFFTLHKTTTSLQEYSLDRQVNLVYFDAFSPKTQPELWTQAMFTKLYGMMVPNGVLVTYCSKSIVRNALKSAGFLVEKIQGPRGKREMVRARKAD